MNEGRKEGRKEGREKKEGRKELKNFNFHNFMKMERKEGKIKEVYGVEEIMKEGRGGRRVRRKNYYRK